MSDSQPNLDVTTSASQSSGSKDSHDKTGNAVEPAQKPTYLDHFVDRAKRHPVLGLIIVGVFCFYIIVSFFDDVDKVYQWITRLREPELELRIVSDVSNDTSAVVTPNWKSPTFSGFSDPLPVTFAIQNNGSQPASNVRIHLLFQEIAVHVGYAGGFIPRSVVPSELEKFKGQRVIELKLDRVEPKSIPEILDNELEVRLQLRFLSATVMVENDMIYVERGIMDFHESELDDLGLFRIHYWITSTEQSNPKHGIVHLRLAPKMMKKISAVRNAQRKVATKQDDVKIELGKIESRKLRSIQTVDLDLSTSNKYVLLPTQVEQIIASSGHWLIVSVSERGQYAEVDVDGDSIVDSFYIRPQVQDISIGTWIELRTKAEMQVVHPYQFFDITPESIHRFAESSAKKQPTLKDE